MDSLLKYWRSKLRNLLSSGICCGSVLTKPFPHANIIEGMKRSVVILPPGPCQPLSLFSARVYEIKRITAINIVFTVIL